MEGEQHNTYDIEFYGPNTMMGRFYLGALKAGAAMAATAGDVVSRQGLPGMYDKGRAAYDSVLCNGEYYVQKYAQVMEKPNTSTARAASPTSSSASGWARIVGPGPIPLEPSGSDRPPAIFQYNFRDDFWPIQRPADLRPQRRKGPAALLPGRRAGGRRCPSYADEVWTGIEYQVATHLIYEGFLDEGLTVVKGVRDRYDGFRRNPWNEFECGHHYARAMSSWGVLLALSGQSYSGPEMRMGFDPKMNADDFRTVWTAGSGWGTYSQKTGEGGGMAVALDAGAGVLEPERARLDPPVGSCGEGHPFDQNLPYRFPGRGVGPQEGRYDPGHLDEAHPRRAGQAAGPGDRLLRDRRHRGAPSSRPGPGWVIVPVSKRKRPGSPTEDDLSKRATLGFLALILSLAASGLTPACSPKVPAVPGPKGHLFIIGGGDRDEPLMRRFIQLAQAYDTGKIVVFTMATSVPDEVRQSTLAEYARYGVKDIAVYHLTREEALKPDAPKILDGAGGVFFTGGDQSRLTAVLLGTPILGRIHEIYEKGGVIGGTSAGAAVQSEFMITGDEKRTKKEDALLAGDPGRRRHPHRGLRLRQERRHRSAFRRPPEEQPPGRRRPREPDAHRRRHRRVDGRPRPARRQVRGPRRVAGHRL